MELVKEHVVQVPMKVVLQRPLSVQNMDIVNVHHINLEVKNVVLALIWKSIRRANKNF